MVVGRMVVGVFVFAACGSNAGPELKNGRCDQTNVTADAVDQPEDPAWSWDTAEHRDHRRRCDYPARTLPADSLGDYALDSKSQFPADLRHVIVIMRENRSFDHYLGEYHLENTDKRRDQFRPLSGRETNPDPSKGGVAVPRFANHEYCAQFTHPDHEWTAAHLQYDNGAMDGFVAASTRDTTDGGGCVAMGYLDRSDLPLYYWLADQFAINESYFSSLLGPTMANISFYYNATSCGTTENLETTAEQIANNIVPWSNGCAKGNSIFDLLASHNLIGKVYNDSHLQADSGAWGLTDYSYADLGSISDFESDVDDERDGKSRLADVVFIEPNYGHLEPPGEKPNENDEHPPSNLQHGQQFVFRVLNKILSTPAVFSHSVVFISWDENGGFYDHVRPPPACPPDDYQPADFDFARYGFRVPFFAISPWSKANFASHYGADHTSILRFIEAWKGLPALTKRDANAWPLLDMFDFSNPREINTDRLEDIKTQIDALANGGCTGKGAN